MRAKKMKQKEKEYLIEKKKSDYLLDGVGGHSSTKKKGRFQNLKDSKEKIKSKLVDYENEFGCNCNTAVNDSKR